MAKINRIGYGQIEANHLSARFTGQIYAQLPAADDIEILENGQFAKYDYANGEVNFTGDGEWMLVYNAVKLYDDRWRESYKDFAMIKSNYTPGHYYLSTEDRDNDENRQYVFHEGVNVGPLKGYMTPRLMKTNVGDIFTTNCLASKGARDVMNEGLELEVGDTLKVGDDGYLVAGEDDAMTWKVVKVYTMPDGQPGIKIQRIK